eukprot:1026326-Pelagomonas_calceolata.AAC.3
MGIASVQWSTCAVGMSCDHGAETTKAEENPPYTSIKEEEAPFGSRVPKTVIVVQWWPSGAWCMVLLLWPSCRCHGKVMIWAGSSLMVGVWVHDAVFRPGG